MFPPRTNQVTMWNSFCNKGFSCRLRKRDSPVGHPGEYGAKYSRIGENNEVRARRSDLRHGSYVLGSPADHVHCAVAARIQTLASGVVRYRPRRQRYRLIHLNSRGRVENQESRRLPEATKNRRFASSRACGVRTEAEGSTCERQLLSGG